MESGIIALIRMLEVRKASLIYGVRDHSINQDVGSAKGARTGISEVRVETQQGNVYMNGEHR